MNVQRFHGQRGTRVVFEIDPQRLAKGCIVLLVVAYQLKQGIVAQNAGRELRNTTEKEIIKYVIFKFEYPFDAAGFFSGAKCDGRLKIIPAAFMDISIDLAIAGFEQLVAKYWR